MKSPRSSVWGVRSRPVWASAVSSLVALVLLAVLFLFPLLSPAQGGPGPAGDAAARGGAAVAQPTRIVDLQTELAGQGALVIGQGGVGVLQATLSPSPAQAGVLTLQSSRSGVASVPASVRFAAGQTRVAVPVNGLSRGDADIRASVPGSSRSARVQASGAIEAPATITLAAGALSASVPVRARDGVTTPTPATLGATAAAPHAALAPATLALQVLPPAPQGPVITAVEPASAAPGASVRLIGSGFAATAAANQVVFAGPAPAVVQSISINPSASASALTVQVPALAESGPITLTTTTTATPTTDPGTPQALSARSPTFTVQREQAFELQASPATLSVVAGSRASASVSLSSSGARAFEGLARLSVAGLPEGVHARFEPPLINPTQAGSLVLSAAPGAPVGSHTLTVRAEATLDGLAWVRERRLTLQVLDAAHLTGVQGRFITPEGLGIAGVTVRENDTTRQAVSDAAGNFRLVGLAAPPFAMKEAYQLYFGTPMGGIPSQPIPVSLPNVSGKEPGEKVDIWFFDGSPLMGAGGGSGEWKLAGQGTVSADGQRVHSDPGAGLTRFCGVCGLVSLSCPPVAKPVETPPLTCPLTGGNPVDLFSGIELASANGPRCSGLTPISTGMRHNPVDAFNNRAGTLTSLGYGWTFEHDVSFLPFEGPQKRLIMPGGNLVNYVDDGSGRYHPVDDPRHAGTYAQAASGGAWEVVRADGTVWHFEPFAGIAGLIRGGPPLFLTRITDPNGNTTTLTRAPNGRLQRIGGVGGRGILLSHGPNGFVDRITDHSGRTHRLLTGLSLDETIARMALNSSGQKDAASSRLFMTDALKSVIAQQPPVHGTARRGGSRAVIASGESCC